MLSSELYTILSNGTPIEIHEAVTNQLNDLVENLLQEKRKALIAEMFNAPLELGETVKREKWNRQSIREGLEKASLKGLNEDFDKNGMKISTSVQDIHSHLKSKGWEKVGANSHYTNDKHPHHQLHVSSNGKEFTHTFNKTPKKGALTGTLLGNGTNHTLNNHLKMHSLEEGFSPQD